MTLEPIETMPILASASARQPQGTVRHRAGRGRLARHGRRRRPVRGRAPCDPGPAWSGSPRPAEVQPTVASFEPSYMTYPLPCDEDGLIQLERGAAGPRTPDRDRPTSSPSGRGWASRTTSGSSCGS